MRYWTTILFLIILLGGCKKSNPESQIVTDCTHNNFIATVDGSPFNAAELIINKNSLVRIYANSKPSTGQFPPLSFFSIFLTNNIPGTYFLGKLGVKRDSVNYFNGEAEYIINLTASTSEGYATDSLFNGILTITNKDEQNRQIYGTFSFTGKKVMTTDTIILSITNGTFQGCY